jgi:hypothetical protein
MSWHGARTGDCCSDRETDVMRLPSLLLGALLALALAQPARANILAQARLEALIKTAPLLSISTVGGRPYVSVKGDGNALGYLDATTLDYGYQIDRQDVLIVPLISGGSGGVFTTLIFTTVDRMPVYAGRIDSTGHLSVYLSQGLINAVTPTYGPHDPQARPSGHHTVRYAIHAHHLVKLDAFDATGA